MAAREGGLRREPTFLVLEIVLVIVPVSVLRTVLVMVLAGVLVTGPWSVLETIFQAVLGRGGMPDAGIDSKMGWSFHLDRRFRNSQQLIIIPALNIEKMMRIVELRCWRMQNEAPSPLFGTERCKCINRGHENLSLELRMVERCVSSSMTPPGSTKRTQKFYGFSLLNIKACIWISGAFAVSGVLGVLGVYVGSWVFQGSIFAERRPTAGSLLAGALENRDAMLFTSNGGNRSCLRCLGLIPTTLSAIVCSVSEDSRRRTDFVTLRHGGMDTESRKIKISTGM